ncbi:hypothetical protein HAX54_048474 [Datura stramonium]|uniref:Uncharacterized protein n=1 Tax=Datura stramonium TaxID=4076 RepID=A0ABS8RQE4_DATST|nr:hypothetical protein [Datura stramonium]
MLQITSLDSCPSKQQQELVYCPKDGEIHLGHASISGVHLPSYENIDRWMLYVTRNGLISVGKCLQQSSDCFIYVELQFPLILFYFSGSDSAVDGPSRSLTAQVTVFLGSGLDSGPSGPSFLSLEGGFGSSFLFKGDGGIEGPSGM